jgi:hypothetical protein
MRAMSNQLSQGVSPDAVGEMVLAAVRENRLYVHTRTRALLDAMPAEA